MTLLTIPQAVNAIQSGQVIAYPTEAVYGLGCDPLDEMAFEALLDLKQRPIEKGVILIASNLQQITDWIKFEDQPWVEQVISSWSPVTDRGEISPPITWVLPARDNVPSWITGGRDTLAVRVSHHPQVKRLCDALNSPIVSTSANLTGQAPAKSVQACWDFFPQTKVLEGELMGLAQPSQIWEAQTLTRLR